MGQFRHHEPCPLCGSRNNLARYDDGGAFCFGCHYSERPTHAPMRHMGSTTEIDSRYHHAIPDDFGYEFRADAIEWLASFYLDLPTAIRHEVGWSPSREQIIYKLGNCWQARNFNRARKEKSKNFTSGDVNECPHIYSAHETEGVRGIVGNTGKETTKDDVRGEVGRGSSSGSLVIVEDPVSAIRVAEATQGESMPLLGSHLGQARLNAVAGLYAGSGVVLWLDSDKYKEARGIADRAKYMGLSTNTIFTELDPKCFTNDEIREILK